MSDKYSILKLHTLKEMLRLDSEDLIWQHNMKFEFGSEVIFKGTCFQTLYQNCSPLIGYGIS